MFGVVGLEFYFLIMVFGEGGGGKIVLEMFVRVVGVVLIVWFGECRL